MSATELDTKQVMRAEIDVSFELDSFYDQLDEWERNGKYTREELLSALTNFDLDEGWLEWIAEGEE